MKINNETDNNLGSTQLVDHGRPWSRLTPWYGTLNRAWPTGLIYTNNRMVMSSIAIITLQKMLEVVYITRWSGSNLTRDERWWAQTQAWGFARNYDRMK